MNWTLIGKRLRNKRLHCHFTQEQLAINAGTSNIYICRIENGTARPTLPMLKNICKALSCPLSYLIDGQNLIAYDKNAEYISRLLDGCSPYKIRLVKQVVESIIKEKNIDFS